MHTAKTAGFRWLPSYYEAVRDLPDAERLEMYDAMADFGFGNETAELPPLLSAIFHLMAPTLEKSVRFEQKQRENSAKGGRPGKTQNETEETQAKPKVTQNDSGENLDVDIDVAVDIDRDVDVDLAVDLAKDIAVENDVVCEKAKPRAARFTPPNLEQVREYCLERRNGIDPQRFLDFYTAKGWRIGKERMKDWKAAVRTWERRDSNGRDHGHGDQDQEIPGILYIS